MSLLKRSYSFISPLNALRFFAAVGIVVFHYGRWSIPFSSSPLHPYVLMANTGVTLFFVLSGFIMVHVYGKKLTKPTLPAIKTFYRARVARIVPLYVLALLLTVWDFHTFGTPIPIRSFFLQLFLIQPWFPHEALKLNFTGWSLSVEMMFYLLFPFLFALYQKWTTDKRFLMTTLVWLLSNAITAAYAISFFPDAERANVFLKFFPLLHLNSFLIGMLAGMWYASAKKKLQPVYLLISLAFLLIYPLVIPEGLQPIHHNGLLAPIFAVLIIGLAQSKNILTKVLSVRAMVIGGDISYGIYILQVPVYDWVYGAYKTFSPNNFLHEESRFFLYLGLLCLISWISLHTIEKLGKRLIRGTA